MTSDRPFNPLALPILAETIVTKLLAQPVLPLPPKRFVGAGVYCLYYGGDFGPYAPIRGCDWPIYVGMAAPMGRERGILDHKAEEYAGLYGRLQDHKRSIREVENLKLEDFCCRFLVVEIGFIPYAESFLISRYRPLWNSAVPGFGIHGPGGGRKGQERSDWDILHPGRKFTKRLPTSTKSAEDILTRIEEHFRDLPTGIPPLLT